MNNEREQATNEEMQDVFEPIAIDLDKEPPTPIIEYNKPLLFAVKEITLDGKYKIVKGQDEHTPDKKDLVCWYVIKGYLVSPEYGTKSDILTFHIFEPLYKRLKWLYHSQRCNVFSCLFSFHTFEYEKKDKDGKPTGEIAQAAQDDLISVSALSPKEYKQCKELLEHWKAQESKKK